MQKGKVSVNTENIFPIIKKFLYTDHEIFLRELISNAVDASQKLRLLASRGDLKEEIGDVKISVKLDKGKKTITVADKGIGMTAEEIDKYINQIAFSGAEEFVEKFKDSKEDANIIGHFGLGFYSSFMVADKVEIHTLSYQDDAEPALWECSGSTDFKIKKGRRKSRGTDIILHINEESEEFLETYKLKSLLDKYCKFLPVEIEFEGDVINNTSPLWKKAPSELSDEDYLNFYKELYPLAEDPLFWIHMNVDYPFNLTGILYFPKLKRDIDPNRNKIQLFSNQVFVTDDVKDVVPDYLMLLHGIIDSPDIPLNVSRSSLQSDSNVKKITGHISKKVSDKLHELYKNNPEDFEKKWDDIGLFVKYGMISDEKFYERAAKFCLLKNTNEEYHLLEEYRDKIKDNQTDKDGNTVVLYTSDSDKQHGFIERAKDKGYDVLIFSEILDQHFIQNIEAKLEKTLFRRVDSDTMDKLIDKDEKNESVLSSSDLEMLKGSIQSVIENREGFEMEDVALSTEDPFMDIVQPEWDRRMMEMSKYGGMPMMGMMKDKYTLKVNSNHPLASKVCALKDDDQRQEVLKQSFDLALLAQHMLDGEALTEFIKRTSEKL